MRRSPLVLGMAVVLVAGLAACTDNGGGGDDLTSHKQTSAIDTNPADSRGPAKPVPGAKRGGTLYALQEQDFEHLDPQNVYISDAESVAQLYSRSLTMFAENGSGKLRLVGDLATGPGTDVDGDCKTWRYTLKTGLKYQDGSTITAADVAYGVARSFSPDIYHGPHYIQQWLAGSLDYNKKYQGPYNGASKVPPGVTVQGTRQLTFHFKQPACDMPYAAAWGTTAPVPASQDTDPLALDTHPFSSGPYKVAQYIRGTELELVRNKYWDPKTDPVRHNYFSKMITYIGATDVQQAQRVLASHGLDADTVARANVPASVVPLVKRDPSARKRVLSGYLPFVQYLNINTERITDVNERRAINYAFDRRAFLQVAGGGTAGDPATTIESPLTIGYQHYDAYPSGRDGDPDKAKQLLDGRHPTLVYAYDNTELDQKQSLVVQQSLERAGFKVVLRPVDSSSYYHQIGLRNSGYDIYVTAWAADWPSGSTIIPQLFDGRSLTTNPTWTWLNVKQVNDRIAELETESANKAATGWAALDKEIMTKYAPVVPVSYQKNYSLVGTNVGGVLLSSFVGAPVYYNAYLKS
jgi:peptide/nickel transport system substrate-binding protein